MNARKIGAIYKFETELLNYLIEEQGAYILKLPF
jgi:hypothetical protein